MRASSLVRGLLNASAMRLVLGIALAAAACGTDVRSSRDDNTVPPDAAVDGQMTTLPPNDGSPPNDGANLTPCEDAVFHSDLAWIQANIFDVHCTQGCHSGTNPTGGMNLSPGVAHANLVGVTSTYDSSWKRVVAGSSAQSMLMVQIGGEPGPELEGYMPWNQPRLCGEMIDSIRRWIDAGATP